MMPAGEEKQPISEPIDSVGDLLYDGDIDQIIASHPEADDEELAQIVWKEYGGNPDGSADPSKTGRRTETDNEDPQQASSETAETKNKKWERLPQGKTVADITTLDELVDLMSSLTFGVVKKYTQPEGGGGMGGGMGGMLAETKSAKLIKLANHLDGPAPDLARAIRRLVVGGALRS